METIGQKLKNTREKKKLAAADVARAIKAKTEYITAMERDDFDKLIAPVYARGFIKLYAQYVGLDPAPLLRQFDGAAGGGGGPPVRPAPEAPAGKRVSAPEKRRVIKIKLAALMAEAARIKLPDLIRLKIPALKPAVLPGKKKMAVVIAVVFLIAVLPILVRQIISLDAGIRVPPSGRWLEDPPDPYLEIPPSETVPAERGAPSP